MILLLGGTGETATLAAACADRQWPVLVSTATDAELELPTDRLISRRQGRLDQSGMVRLIHEQKIRVILDATHPFATDAHKTAQTAATATGIPYLRWEREPLNQHCRQVINVKNHEEAAKQATGMNLPVLLTTGSRNLLPYINAAKSANIPLFARVLPHHESELACRGAGLRNEQVIYARGPFSVEDTVRLIKRHNIGVLVTKDSGKEGGLPEKLEAARQTGCHVVLIERPPEPGAIATFNKVNALLTAISAHLEQV